MSCLIISDMQFYHKTINVDVSSEPGKTSKIEHFAKIE